MEENEGTCTTCNYCDVRKVMPDPCDSSSEAFFAAHAMNAIVRVHAGDMTIEKEVALAFEYADRMLEKSL